MKLLWECRLSPHDVELGESLGTGLLTDIMFWSPVAPFIEEGKLVLMCYQHCWWLLAFQTWFTWCLQCHFQVPPSFSCTGKWWKLGRGLGMRALSGWRKSGEKVTAIKCEKGECCMAPEMHRPIFDFWQSNVQIAPPPPVCYIAAGALCMLVLQW